MPISDKKKCQTLINLIGQKAILLQEFATQLKAYRQAYQDQNVDPAGTALDGNVPAVSTWIDNVNSVASAAVATGFIDNIRPTHKNNALGDI